MELRLLNKNELEEFILGIQDSFQKGYEAYFGKCDDTIIPRRDILESLNKEGSKSYVMVDNNKIIGGCVVVIDNINNINSLDILYVKNDTWAKGVGYKIWSEVEGLYPNCKKWVTCTPYFDQRNINFYVNKCKFHIVEFFNKYHVDKNCPSDFIGDAGEGMFKFEKIINN